MAADPKKEREKKRKEKIAEIMKKEDESAIPKKKKKSKKKKDDTDSNADKSSVRKSASRVSKDWLRKYLLIISLNSIKTPLTT